MDGPEVMLCERCWHPIDPDGDHLVRQIRDEAHPLLAVLYTHSHLEGDPACDEARPSRIRVVRETRAFPVVADPPPEGDPPDG